MHTLDKGKSTLLLTKQRQNDRMTSYFHAHQFTNQWNTNDIFNLTIHYNKLYPILDSSSVRSLVVTKNGTEASFRVSGCQRGARAVLSYAHLIKTINKPQLAAGWSHRMPLLKIPTFISTENIFLRVKLFPYIYYVVAEIVVCFGLKGHY